jgi:hypothetical protein
MDKAKIVKLVAAGTALAAGAAILLYYYYFYVKINPDTRKVFIITVKPNVHPLPENEIPDFSSEELPNTAIE